MQWNIQVMGAGVYRLAQKHTQTTYAVFLGFMYKGLRHYQIADHPAITQCPLLTLVPDQTQVSFEFGPDRENWVVFLRSDDIRQSRSAHRLEVRYEQQWLELPTYVAVEPAMADWWQSYFMRMAELLQSPTPANHLRVELMVFHVLQQFLDNEPPGHASPEQRLRSLIDHDPSASRSLEQLARQCGYSADHLRMRFEKRFGLTPIAYRQRRRMAKAMDYITQSSMSIKQMAFELGFTQVAHFSAAFRQAYNITPTEAIKRYRKF